MYQVSTASLGRRIERLRRWVERLTTQLSPDEALGNRVVSILRSLAEENGLDHLPIGVQVRSGVVHVYMDNGLVSEARDAVHVAMERDRSGCWKMQVVEDTTGSLRR